jgi:hypothetical protein
MIAWATTHWFLAFLLAGCALGTLRAWAAVLLLVLAAQLRKL